MSKGNWNAFDDSVFLPLEADDRLIEDQAFPFVCAHSDETLHEILIKWFSTGTICISERDV
jgi:hypothetical protein